MKQEFITIKIARNTYRKIFIDEIIYCKADRCYSIIKTTDTDYSFSNPLKELENQFNNPLFIRVNRSYIVNIAKCVELKTGKTPSITLNNDEQIKIFPECINKIAEYLKVSLSEVKTY